MRLAILLIVLVSIRHNSSWWINDITGFPVRGVHYILGGLWESALCLALWIHLPKDAKPLGGLACIIGISEGMQMSICRLFGNPKGNICDVLLGIPVGATLVSLYALFLCLYVGRNKMNNRALILVPILAAAEVSYLSNSIPVGLGLLALCYATWRAYGTRT